MNEKDTVLFGFSSGGKDFSQAKLMPVRDGDRIDLGGDYEVEVFDIPGHTPGSVAFLDRKRGIMLTGDALGVWMQVPNALCVSEYKKSLEHFLERISAPEYRDICMLAGHKKQEGGPGSMFGAVYNPNNRQRVKDMIILCEKVLEEDVEFTRYPFEFGRPAYAASYGHAAMVFSEEIIK